MPELNGLPSGTEMINQNRIADVVHVLFQLLGQPALLLNLMASLQDFRLYDI